MKRLFLLLPIFLLASLSVMAEEAKQDSAAVAVPTEEKPLWKQKLYYGYNFDIYYHHDSNPTKKENGWSFSFIPELGWRIKERLYVGMRFGGSYQDSYTTLSSEDLSGETSKDVIRVRRGSWEVTPYVRYRLKTFINDKFGIWLEAHVFTGMDFPSVYSGSVVGTEYEGLKHTINYGVQVAPVITYQFNKRSTFQLFFSIISLGYSGTTRCYSSATEGDYKEYSNDVIIFSGKLRNLLTNQFAPGLYGVKFGVIKSF
ncbi:MAG: hypothetical protein J5612_05260 [Paludibacteraceae bacterium]|nr:hypothetical protein [Paludibacteraceae bacterium]